VHGIQEVVGSFPSSSTRREQGLGTSQVLVFTCDVDENTDLTSCRTIGMASRVKTTIQIPDSLLEEARNPLIN
jgi:hypothetical protein